MAFKDREEFLDALYDHIFPEKDYPDGPDDDDENFFEHVAKFFPDATDTQGGTEGSGGTNPPRRRRSSGQSGGSSGPRRRRRSAATSGSGYGNQAFFGTK